MEVVGWRGLDTDQLNTDHWLLDTDQLNTDHWLLIEARRAGGGVLSGRCGGASWVGPPAVAWLWVAPLVLLGRLWVGPRAVAWLWVVPLVMLGRLWAVPLVLLRIWVVPRVLGRAAGLVVLVEGLVVGWVFVGLASLHYAKRGHFCPTRPTAGLGRAARPRRGLRSALRRRRPLPAPARPPAALVARAVAGWPPGPPARRRRSYPPSTFAPFAVSGQAEPYRRRSCDRPPGLPGNVAGSQPISRSTTPTTEY